MALPFNLTNTTLQEPKLSWTAQDIIKLFNDTCWGTADTDNGCSSKGGSGHTGLCLSWNYTAASKTFVLAMNENLATKILQNSKRKFEVMCDLPEVNPALGTTLLPIFAVRGR